MDQDLQKQMQTSKGFNLGKFLKLIFLGNGKYWPTTLYIWNVIIFLSVAYLDYQGFNYSIITGVGLVTGTILVILQFLISLPLQIDSLYDWFKNIGLTDEGCSGILCFHAFNKYLVIIIWCIIIFVSNYLIVKAIEKHKSKKKPQQ